MSRPDPRPYPLQEWTAKLVHRFGPSVATWVAAVPDLVDQIAARWALGMGEPINDGASSITLHCLRADGRPAVLKLSPDRPFLTEQTAVLRWTASSGRVPDVLAADSADGAVLLAEIRPGTCVDELPEPPTPAAFGALLADLHGVPLPPPDLLGRDLRQRVEEFLRRALRRLDEPVLAAQLHKSDFERALGELDHLLATASTTVLLHGDLHPGNVLDGGPERGLVAIDPKSCLGDPCFDAVDHVVAGAGLGADGSGDGIGFRLTALAAERDLDADRLHAWCRLVAAVTAIPLLRQGGRQRAVDELLALAR
jgi:streptomycin 6-kinase